RGQISLELGDENAVCEIVNSPMVAEVEIVKSLISADGSGTPVVEEGWLVGASATGGTLDGPAAQETDETGAALWSVDFADKNATADLSVRVSCRTGIACTPRPARFHTSMGRRRRTPWARRPGTSMVSSPATTFAVTSSINPGPHPSSWRRNGS